MTKLAALLIVLIPSIALADKNFDDGSSGSYDCSADSIVNINQDGGAYTLTGECSEVHVNGSNVQLTIESTDSLAINGSANTARVGLVDTILVNGAQNTVHWHRGKTGHRPFVAIEGESNSVGRAR